MADAYFNTYEDWSNAMRLGQQDPKWGNISWGDIPDSPMSKSGCGPTSYAMVCNLYGYHVTPDQVATTMGKYHTPNGLDGQNAITNPAVTGDKFGVYMTRVSPDEALQALKRGDVVIACHNTGRFTVGGGHYIVYSHCTEDDQVRVIHCVCQGDRCIDTTALLTISRLNPISSQLLLGIGMCQCTRPLSLYMKTYLRISPLNTVSCFNTMY